MYKYLLENKRTGIFHIPDLTNNNGETTVCNFPADKLTPYNVARYGTTSRICKKCIKCRLEEFLPNITNTGYVNGYVLSAFNSIFENYSYNHQQSPRVSSEIDNDSFKFIPADTSGVVRNFIAAKQYLDVVKGMCRPSFVDCGCGIGNILFIAKTIFKESEITGIEFDQRNIDLLNMLTCNNKSKLFNIVHGDLFDVTNYEDYDIIYMYRPIWGNSLDRFYNKIINEAKPGCLFIHGSDRLGGSGEFYRNKKVKKLFIRYDIFEKI